MIASRVADKEALDALEEEQSLGNFLRRLIGLDRAAAKAAFSNFLTIHRLTSDQTEFLGTIIDHLTGSVAVEPERFYESPSSDLDDRGIAGVFSKEQAAEIIRIVRKINEAAEAA